MSWDVVLFNSTEQIVDPATLDETQLNPTDFYVNLNSHFSSIKQQNNHISILIPDGTIEYFVDNELSSNIIFNLYGESALFELIIFAKKFGYQIFDTALGSMIHLNKPEINGYENFQAYLQKILHR